ncbi:DUF3800 domain-containing protein [Patescibacteria group bacterium]|nr:DUF3800 domain-containing protein [Patescibacteria group bacterium]MBU1256445.1 DUF3800 domain-containing protein [Patescibacteria group bacterium]MBU1457549.1 DUF3800 domain-containing protein [Patescibacteria group bacterium]
MKNAYIFIDETGKVDKKDKSEYFCLSAIIINDVNRERLKNGLEKLKQKYFGSKGYVIHGSQVKRGLKHKKKDLNKFSKDFRKIALSINFFALCTITDKHKAYSRGWLKTTILEKSYRMILSNLIKFVMAKDYKGQIIAEASAHEQDLHLYKNFFHFMANGIPKLHISTDDVKKHVTAISYVTKQNDDNETQFVDLLAGVIKIKHKLDSGQITKDQISDFDKELLYILERKLFTTSARVIKKRKSELYKAIIAYAKYP